LEEDEDETRIELLKTKHPHTDTDTNQLQTTKKEQGKENVDMEDVLDGFQQKARDHARIPMQWDASSNAGFTTGTPWMRVFEDDARAGWNAADQSRPSETHHEESVLAFWKRALVVRKTHPVLTYGDFEMRLETDERVMAYVRTLGHVRAYVVLNFTADVIEVPIEKLAADGAVEGEGLELVLCNYPDAVANDAGGDATTGNKPSLSRRWRGYEARVYIQPLGN